MAKARKIVTRFRERNQHDEPLTQCSCVGLWGGGSGRGFCSQPRYYDPETAVIGPYCYYHTKVQKGMLKPQETYSEPIPGMPDGVGCYPIWPLPANGYVATDLALIS